ncbi:hypothetical protein ACLB2K_028537 [Fragaria x ananassa]
MAATGFWFHLLWSRWRSLLVARSRWWLGVVAWQDLFTSSCCFARSMGWLCGGVIWFAGTGSVMDLTPIWEQTGCGFRREDNGRTWRTVVRRFRRDGEGKTWSAAVVVSISWIRVSGWAWAQLLGLSSFIVVVLFKLVFGSGFQISNKFLLY